MGNLDPKEHTHGLAFLLWSTADNALAALQSALVPDGIARHYADRNLRKSDWPLYAVSTQNALSLECKTKYILAILY